jgi:hypothetical protein
MELFRHSGATDVGPSETMRPLYWVLVLLSLVPLCIVLPMTSPKVGVAAIAAWIAMLWAANSLLRGQLHYIVPVWVAFYPYCYYLLSFPKQRSIFTVDRAFILLLAIEMLIMSRQDSRAVPLTRDIRISAYLWALYLLVCFLSLAVYSQSDTFGYYRLLVEGMLMPALLGLYAMRYFPVVEDLRKLHTCACLLALGLFATGLIELTTDIDLFPWSGAEPMFTDTHLRRADGPFEQAEILSVVAMLAFFLIVYLRRLMPRKVASGRALLHKMGAMAAFGAALIPLNRGLVFALVPVALIDSSSRSPLLSRRMWASFFGIITLGAVACWLLYPGLYEDRVTRPDNVYQRIAQDRETLRVVREYPLFGVGFDLYHDVASRNPRYLATWKGIESMNFPHNALMTVLSEEGIIGLLLYVSAQAFLIRAMWKMRKAYPPGWLAFLYCVLVYVIIGIDYATVYFSDINLFYLFTLGVLFQLQTRIFHETRLTALSSHDENLPLQLL